MTQKHLKDDRTYILASKYARNKLKQLAKADKRNMIDFLEILLDNYSKNNKK